MTFERIRQRAANDVNDGNGTRRHRLRLRLIATSPFHINGIHSAEPLRR